MCVLHNGSSSDAAGRAQAPERMQDKLHPWSVFEDIDLKIALIDVCML